MLYILSKKGKQHCFEAVDTSLVIIIICVEIRDLDPRFFNFTFVPELQESPRHDYGKLCYISMLVYSFPGFSSTPSLNSSIFLVNSYRSAW